MTRRGRLAFVCVATVGLLLAARSHAVARCGDLPGDEDAVAAARMQVDRDCPCAGSTDHGAYVRCATETVRQRVRDGSLPKHCRGRVRRCASQSTCGRPDSVTCCRTAAAGTTRCHIRETGPACTAAAGGTACIAPASSCCDACTASGCAGSTTTTTTTSTSTTHPGSCRFDETTARCTGTCPVSGEACVRAAAGACVCSPFVCRQCFLTIGVNICIDSFCSATVPCAFPNEYCDLGDCPAVECPCCPACGDGRCAYEDEWPCGCPADCGPAGCDPRTPTCGDGACDRSGTPGETHETCPADCRLACRPCQP